MGLMNRIYTVIRQKVNLILDKHEDPRQVLDYSYIKQAEMLNKLRRDIAEVVTAKKRLEMQKSETLGQYSYLGRTGSPCC